MQALHGQIAKNQEKDKILKVAGRKKKKKKNHFVTVLICISLMTQDVKHLFICLFPFYFFFPIYTSKKWGLLK